MNKLSKPWINNSILNMIKHRDRLFQEKKDDPSNFYIKGTYKLFRNCITIEIKKLKRNILNNSLKTI